MSRARAARAGRAAALLLLGAAAGLRGEPLDLARGEQDDDFQRNTAHVNKYPETDQLVTKANALVAQGRYAEALAIYLDAVERKPHTVVFVDKARALGIRDYVLHQVAGWPEEGKAIYRRKVDPLAEQLFQTAKRNQDADTMEGLAEEYPFSSLVDDALAYVANLRLDAGENERAAEALARLLTVEGDVPRAVSFARLGLAYSRAGQKALLSDLVERAGREEPGAVIRVGGGEVRLVDHLRGLAHSTRDGEGVRRAPSLPAWDTLAGALSGSKLAEPGVELTRLAWAVTVGLPRFDTEEDLGVRRGSTLSLTPDFRPLFPAVSDGILYVHNETRLLATNFYGQAGERPLWEYEIRPRPPGEAMFDNRVIYPVTVHEGRVYANLLTAIGGAEDQLGYVRVKFPFPRRALFAFDAAQGKLLWKVGGQVKTEVFEDNITFSATPAPEGDRLYVGAVKQKHSTDPFEHYLVCLDAASGRAHWAGYVASGLTEINLFGNSTRESLGSPVTLSEESAFYCTNHGVVAAVDKKSGRIRWLYRYQQLPVNPTRSVYVMKNRLGWVNSPPVLADGVLVVTPTDSPYAYGLDARTGQLRWQRPRERELRTLYGAREGTVVLGGDRVDFVEARTGKVVAQSEDVGGTGRGVVAEDGVYVATKEKFVRLAWDGTEASSRAWPGGRADGGNVLVVDGSVVLSTQDSVEVYFDRRGQEQAIRAELARHPDNLAALYGAALRFLQAGDAEEAAELLGRVVERAARSPRPEDERLHRAARRRLYAVSLRAGQTHLSAARLDKAEESITRARRAAPDAASRAESSLLLGRVRQARADAGGALEEFQKLLFESAAEEGADAVFEQAREAIDAVLRAAGRDAYASHEQEARKLLARARREGTPDALSRVFRLHPNSLAAEEGLFEAAGAHAKLGRVDEEIVALRRFLREYPTSSRAPEAYAGLVRALEQKGRHGGAGVLLRRMSRLFPDAEVTDGARRVKARDFADERLNTPAYARASLAGPRAALTVPLRPDLDYTETEFREGIPLKVAGSWPAAVTDLLFMNYGSAVKAIHLRTREEAWTVKTQAPAQFAAFEEETLILADERSVRRVDAQDGKVRWRFDGQAAMRGFGVVGGVLAFFTSDVRGDTVAGLDLSRGAVAWSRPYEGAAETSVHAAGDAVAFITSGPNRVHLFDAQTGLRLLKEAGYSPGAAAQVEHVTDTQIVIRCEGKYIEAYALPSGARQWRVNLSGMATRDVKAAPGELVVLGALRPSEQPFLMAVDLRSGKIVRMREGLPVGDPKFLLVDDGAAYVVSREGDQSIAVRRVGLADLGVVWTTRLGEDRAVLFPPELAERHVVLGTFEEGQNRLWAYGGLVLDKSGKPVQNIKSEFEFEQPPNYALSNDRLVFSVGKKVVVYR